MYDDLFRLGREFEIMNLEWFKSKVWRWFVWIRKGMLEDLYELGRRYVRIWKSDSKVMKKVRFFRLRYKINMNEMLIKIG